MTPANASPSPLSLLTGLALLGPLGVLAWQAPRTAPAQQEEAAEVALEAPLPPKPAALPAMDSSLLVAKLKNRDVLPADEALSDAPRDELAGTLTGTLAEIEAKLAQERAPRPERVARPRKSRAVARGLPGCINECRIARTACVGRRGAAKSCRSAYVECAAVCRDR